MRRAGGRRGADPPRPPDRPRRRRAPAPDAGRRPAGPVLPRPGGRPGGPRRPRHGPEHAPSPRAPRRAAGGRRWSPTRPPSTPGGPTTRRGRPRCSTWRRSTGCWRLGAGTAWSASAAARLSFADRNVGVGKAWAGQAVTLRFDPTDRQVGHPRARHRSRGRRAPRSSASIALPSSRRPSAACREATTPPAHRDRRLAPGCYAPTAPDKGVLPYDRPETREAAFANAILNGLQIRSCRQRGFDAATDPPSSPQAPGRRPRRYQPGLTQVSTTDRPNGRCWPLSALPGRRVRRGVFP